MSQVLAEETWEIEDLVENLITEDDAPVDNILSAKQQRLLTETLYSSWKPSQADENSDEPRDFFADANVGVFFSVHAPPLVPDVFHAGVSHNEDQPSHLHILDTEICATRCAEEYGNPCQRFCPAAVYEMEENAKSGRREIKVNFSNCVHCKTCDVADPYQIINWVTPEGGGGPTYKGM